MTTIRYDLYGSEELDLEQLEARVPERLGLTFTAHDSSYWGPYSIWGDAAGEEIRITSNFVDEDGELLEEDFPQHRSFVHVARSVQPEVVGERLLGIDSLQLLRTTTLQR